MSVPYIPVLMSDISQLTNPTDIIKYVLWAYTSMPKFINDTFTAGEISFIYDVAAVDYDADRLVNLATNNLTMVLNKYFQNASVNVNISVDWLDDVRYELTIQILVSMNGQTYSLDQNVEVDSNGNFALKLGTD